jgi:hypothetical protein
MLDSLASLNAILQKGEVRSGLKETATQRLGYCSEEEQLQGEALLNSALDPRCSFDRENQLMLCALAVCPDQVGWSFKLRERLHRLSHNRLTECS